MIPWSVIAQGRSYEHEVAHVVSDLHARKIELPGRYTSIASN